MTPSPAPDDRPDLVPLWAVPLNEADTPAPSPPPKAVPVADDDIQFLRYVLEIPPADFQPRLSRFDEAA